MEQLHRSSYDLTMLADYKTEIASHDPMEFGNKRWGMRTAKNGRITLAADEMIMVTTVERIRPQVRLVAHVENGDWLTMGVIIQATSDTYDTGFYDHINLLVRNISHAPVELRLDKPIARVAFNNLHRVSRGVGGCDRGSLTGWLTGN